MHHYQALTAGCAHLQNGLPVGPADEAVYLVHEPPHAALSPASTLKVCCRAQPGLVGRSRSPRWVRCALSQFQAALKPLLAQKDYSLDCLLGEAGNARYGEWPLLGVLVRMISFLLT